MDAMNHKMKEEEVSIVWHMYHPEILAMEQPAMEDVFHQQEELCSHEYYESFLLDIFTKVWYILEQ
jgi:hypothetical protein